jgi:diguanylate cyclase
MQHLNAPLRAVLLGAAVLLGLTVLLAGLWASDLSLSPFDAVRIDTSASSQLVTRHNPFGVLALAAFAALGLGVLVIGAAKIWPMALTWINTTSRKALSNDLDSVVELCRKLIEVNGAYSDTLLRFNASIAGQSQAAPLAIVVQELISEHQRMRDETRVLADELKSKQAEKEAIEEKISEVEAAGNSDAMTGVGNRRAFDQQLRNAIQSCRTAGRSLSLVMADIDHFKRINDTYGHQVGDEVIKLLAKVISRSLRDSDVAARYGGEEFGIIMPGTDLAIAKSVAERIRKELETQKVVLRESGQNLGAITASFGVAVLQRGEDAKGLIRRADSKLYAAKSAGRNRVLG